LYIHTDNSFAHGVVILKLNLIVFWGVLEAEQGHTVVLDLRIFVALQHLSSMMSALRNWMKPKYILLIKEYFCKILLSLQLPFSFWDKWQPWKKVMGRN